jgi:hypothetical protein
MLGLQPSQGPAIPVTRDEDIRPKLFLVSDLNSVRLIVIYSNKVALNFAVLAVDFSLPGRIRYQNRGARGETLFVMPHPPTISLVMKSCKYAESHFRLLEQSLVHARQVVAEGF